MLQAKTPVATVAVRDIGAARRFYEHQLGLTPANTDMPSVVSYNCGSVSLLVYQSDFAGTNKATCVTWMVGDDLSDVVASLKEKGVAFERYEMPEAVRDGDIYSFGDIRNAWFKDPDGNIHNLVNG